MAEYLPLLIVGAIIGAFTLVFTIGYFVLKKKNAAITFDRHTPDRVIVARLMKYAKDYWKDFLAVFFIMLLSIGHNILSPLLIGHIEEIVKGNFEMSYLLMLVGFYGGILLISLLCTYLQAVLLQKIGQKILSRLRMDIFTHIESLSHEQLNNIPVGKLVTRVTNDTNAISMMFTNVLVTMVKNVMVLFGVLVSMLAINYALWWYLR